MYLSLHRLLLFLSLSSHKRENLNIPSILTDGIAGWHMNKIQTLAHFITVFNTYLAIYKTQITRVFSFLLFILWIRNFLPEGPTLQRMLPE